MQYEFFYKVSVGAILEFYPILTAILLKDFIFLSFFDIQAHIYSGKYFIIAKVFKNPILVYKQHVFVIYFSFKVHFYSVTY
jgi:hypothetical protein